MYGRSNPGGGRFAPAGEESVPCREPSVPGGEQSVPRDGRSAPWDERSVPWGEPSTPWGEPSVPWGEESTPWDGSPPDRGEPSTNRGHGSRACWPKLTGATAPLGTIGRTEPARSPSSRSFASIVKEPGRSRGMGRRQSALLIPNLPRVLPLFARGRVRIEEVASRLQTSAKCAYYSGSAGPSRMAARLARSLILRGFGSLTSEAPPAERQRVLFGLALRGRPALDLDVPGA